MKIKTIIVTRMLILLLSFGFPFTAFANVEENEINMIEDILRTENVHGSSVSIYQNGESIYINQGKTGLFSNQLISEHSVFEAGSIGKSVTAYIVLKMVDEELIPLNEPIAKYVSDDLLSKSSDFEYITLQELLSHTAGFSPSFELKIDKKIYFEPGSKFSYSGVGYIYLQDIIENISGKTLEQTAREYVFEPLEMTNSTFETAETVIPYINSSSAVIYSLLIFVILFVLIFICEVIIKKILKKQWKYKALFMLSFFASAVINIVLLKMILSKFIVWFLIFYALLSVILFIFRKLNIGFYLSFVATIVCLLVGGILLNIPMPFTSDIGNTPANAAYTFKTSTDDLGKFSKELVEQYNSGSTEISAMFEAQVEAGANNFWGMGLAIETIEDKKYYWHTGINPGFQSIMVVEPETRMYVVILTNSDNGLKAVSRIISEVFSISGEWEIIRNTL